MSQSPSTPDQGSAPAGGEPKGPFGKVMLFLRQVIDELKKVVVPTRRELVNYTTVVLVFVLVVIGIVTGFDAVFSRGAEALFGGSSSGVEQPAPAPADGGAGDDGAVDDSAENGD